MRHPRTRSARPRLRKRRKGGSRLLSDDHFTQTVARQKKLHRFELLKQLLQAATVEQSLCCRALSVLGYLQGARILNAEGVTGNHRFTLGGMEHGEQITLRLQDAQQPVDGSRE